MCRNTNANRLKSPKRFTIVLDIVIVAVPVPDIFAVVVEAEAVVRNSCASNNYYYRPSCVVVLMDRENHFAHCFREIVAQVHGLAADQVATELVAVAHRIAFDKIADDYRFRTLTMAAAAAAAVIVPAPGAHSCSLN